MAAFRLLPYILRDPLRLQELRRDKPIVPADIEIHEDQEAHDLREEDNDSEDYSDED